MSDKGLPDPDDPHLREPIDRVARRVVGRGEHFLYAKTDDERWSATPFPMREVPATRPATFINLTGVKVGWLTIVGLATTANNAGWSVNADPLLPKKRPISRNYKGACPVKIRGRESGGARWVCRCVCGAYTLRSSKGIKQQIDNPSWRKYPDACIQCRMLDKARNKKETT